MKKIEKQSIPNVMNLLLMVKSTFMKPSLGLYDVEKIVVWKMMDVFYKVTGKEKVYTKKES